MRVENIKKAFAFLIICFILNINSIAVAKRTTADSVMKETLGNSIIEQEYPSGTKVLPAETEEEMVQKDPLKGAITQSIDITLENCIRLALGNNSSIKSAMYEVIASHERIKQVWANYFPEISWTSQASKIRQLELEDALSEILIYRYFLLGQISVTQMLYDFGITQNEATIKKINYNQSKLTLTEAINTVICDVKDAYYSLLYAIDRERIALETVERYKSFYNRAKAYYEIGISPKVDVTIAEVNLSNAKLKLIEAENAISLATSLLNMKMGVQYFGSYRPKERLTYYPIELSLSDAFELAKKSRPDLQIADSKIKEAEQTIKLAKKAYLPTLEARASYQRGGSTFNSNFGYYYGIYLDFDAVNILYNQSRIKEIKTLYDKQVADSAIIRETIRHEIQTAYLNLNEKKNKIPVSMLQVKQAKENYELSFGRYTVGEASPIELKDAQNLYNDAQLTYYQTLYEFNSAKAKLEKSIGRNILGIQEPKIEIAKNK